MAMSTIESIEGMDTINIESIPTNNLKKMLDGINREIEKFQKDKQIILSELERKGEKI